ncbi:MAG TPA: urate hydroxylase PuuD [Gemmatimonadaceae bacterium]|nr:urate hydroxylase PuuD [Gemmatimonadaceae bacterium]
MLELLDLVARWVHVIAGIMWIGNSMLFNWLDRSLRPGQGDVYGDLWLIHSGGFYLVEKNKGERRPDGTRALPTPLHWFKWQAYTTWISGAALLVVVYYVGGRALIVDPAIKDIPSHVGSAIAISTIIGAWLLYELLWRAVAQWSGRAARAGTLAVLAGASWILLSFLSGRAAFLHVGAMLGTLMAANVVFTIMPAQRELVSALAAGREPMQHLADPAKLRSIHNNYFTFPAIVLMLSAHFPALYSQRSGFGALVMLGIAGAGVRHILNIRFTYAHWKPALAVAIALPLILLGSLMMVKPSDRRTGDAAASPPTATFADAQRIIDRRCASCHSANPADISLGAMPSGVAFDSPQQIQALTDRILERAVTTRTMPPANKTRMTDAEREVLRAWASRSN